MVGRSHRPDLLERLVRQAKDNTPRSVAGLARGATPGMVRDRVAARARSSGQPVITSRASKIDGTAEWGPITGTSVDTFTLTYAPIRDSWNVNLNGLGLRVDDYAIAGRTLTILDPTDLFDGASGSDEWDLEVQYDYLAGVPTAPLPPPGAYVGAATIGSFTNSAYAVTPPAHTAGNLLLAFVAVDFSATLSTLSGWTVEGVGSDGSGRNTYVFSRIGTGSTTTVSAALSGTSWYHSVCVAYDDLTSVVDFASATDASGSSHATPGVSSGSRVVHVVTGRPAQTTSAVSAGTLRNDSNSGSSPQVAVADVANATGPVTFTQSGSAQAVMLSVGLS